MTAIQHLNAGLMFCASALALLSAQAAHAESWLAFGDSLTDTGNAYALTGGAIPDPDFYTGGRFSNGPVWFDRIAGDHGLLADQLLGSADREQRNWNFAVGGATSGEDPLDPATGTPPGLRTQVDMARALIDVGAIRAGSDTTAVLWAGANDHGMWLTHPGRDAALDGLVADAVAGNIDAAARGIADAGVGRVAVLNLFDFSLAPTTSLLPEDIRAAGDAMVAHHNAALLRQAESADAETGAQILLVDVHTLFDEITRDPAAWGFESLSPCLPDGGAPDCTVPGSADRRVFWDGTHLTSAAQGLVAEMVQGTLAAGQDLPQLSRDTTSLAFGLADRHMDDERVRARSGAAGGWIVANRFDVSAGNQNGSYSGLSAGWIGRTETLTWGGSLSWGEGGSTAGRTSTEANGWTATAFLRQDFGAVGLTGQLGWGHTSLDVLRKTSFSPAAIAAGQTDAESRIVDLSADYRIDAGAVTLIFDGGLTWADSRNDGWTESGGGLMNASVDAGRVRTTSARLGLTAATDINLGRLPTTAFGTVAWNEVLSTRSTGGRIQLGSGQWIDSADISPISEGLGAEIGVAVDLGGAASMRASWKTSSVTDPISDGLFSASIGVTF
ncbi:autotransporter domain-containing protein [Paracoccaceae bacterium]